MIRAFQWDLARQVERLDWLLAQLPRYADWGYQELYLHLEDAVEYPSLPEVARRDAFSYRQLERLVAAAGRVGIGVVPIVNLLGHTQYLIKVPGLRDLNERRQPDGSPQPTGQICPLHPRTLEIAAALLRDMAPFCTAGKVHVGLDESYHLGQHPLSIREIRRIGLAAHFAGHVKRLQRLTDDLGLQLGMWADMLYFLPDAIPLLPPDIVAYEWYYHAFRRHPRVELFNFHAVDLATPLRRQGIAMYGCPMNGAFRYEPMPNHHDRLANIVAWWDHAKRTDAAGFLVTGWEPNRLALELTTAIDAAAADLWLAPRRTGPKAMLAHGYRRCFGRCGSPGAAALALAADAWPFGGYPRWEINERWDTVSRLEPLGRYLEERRALRRLAARGRRWPHPTALQASLAFRLYLAERDVFVRRALRGKASARDTTAFERALGDGRQAAETMWGLTRRPSREAPNVAMLRRDAARFAAWRRREPVFGPAWQLSYVVVNQRPGTQKVSVEQAAPSGEWRVKQSCHTIEFQTAAARPRGGFARHHAAPVEWDGNAAQPPRLRITMAGVGRVRITQAWLTDGKRRRRVLVEPPVLDQPPGSFAKPALLKAQHRVTAATVTVR